MSKYQKKRTSWNSFAFLEESDRIQVFRRRGDNMKVRNMIAGAVSFILVYAFLNGLMFGWEKTWIDATMQTGVFGVCILTAYIVQRIRRK